ncbi:FtsX-like permease family protein [Streptomyces sp. NPDC060194]|uniref:ABC transporter permease n=1 Tax=Streptomyces sp. NPDC060194 TaxID=3347069 RepID=UPI0036521B4A
MSGRITSWRAALRIARRDAVRAKGRSLLVLSMIAVPILGVSALDLTLRSAELSTVEQLERTVGAADARLSGSGNGGEPLYQNPTDTNEHMPPGGYEDGSFTSGPSDVAGGIPAGAKSVTDTTGAAKFRTENGIARGEVRELKATDPLTDGLLTLLDGRFARSSGEVAVTAHFLEDSGLGIGSALRIPDFDREYRIVGSYELPGNLKADQVVALPGDLVAPLQKAMDAQGLPGPGASTSYLVDVPGARGFTWNMVKEANEGGALVTSRAVHLNPPADSQVPLFQEPSYQDWGSSAADDAAAVAVLATIVGLAILEICLLAGPAFAVGARRSRRQLGLVGANGGDRRHIRAIVLSGGLVIGLAAAVVGTVLGLGLTFALRPLLEDTIGKRFGSFDVRPLELLAIGGLAVLTGLLAAVVPAITASRQTVLASLTGRRGVRRANRVLPVVGTIAFALGASLALYGSTMTSSPMVVAGGSALAELGVVALTPTLVGLFGRAGRWLPLSPRLALRDAVRNRGRTAPAVAAVLAAVAGTVAVATYQASSDAQARAEYTAQLPAGASYLLSQEGGGRKVPALREAVSETFPVAVRADVDRLVVGNRNCEDHSEAKGCGVAELIVPKANECPLYTEEAQKFTPEENRRLSKDWRCEDSGPSAQSEVFVGDDKLLKVLGIEDEGAARALREGRPVVLDRRLAQDGRMSLRIIADSAAYYDAMEKAGEDVDVDTLPGATVRTFSAHVTERSVQNWGVKVIMPEQAVARAADSGLMTASYGAYFTTEATPTGAQTQKVEGAIDRLGTEASLYTERGFTERPDIVLLALALFAGVITIGAAGIATGLAQADAEADLRTLAAVGAPPRVRRTLSGFQCGVVALMGVVLGSAAGVLPAIGLRLSDRRAQQEFVDRAMNEGWGGDFTAPYVPVVIPWETLGILLIAVPLGATLLAAVVTRSQSALVRRDA